MLVGCVSAQQELSSKNDNKSGHITHSDSADRQHRAQRPTGPGPGSSNCLIDQTRVVQYNNKLMKLWL